MKYSWKKLFANKFGIWIEEPITGIYYYQFWFESDDYSALVLLSNTGVKQPQVSSIEPDLKTFLQENSDAFYPFISMLEIGKSLVLAEYMEHTPVTTLQ